MARPLIKKDQKGVLYVRPPSIEAKIDGALGQDWGVLSKRAKITDPNVLDFPPRECLVHLIRDAIRRNDQRLATVLMRPLLLRCAANLLKTVPEGGMRNAAAVREDILSSFQTLFTEEAAEDALDYFECKFGSAFKSLRLRTSPAFTIHDAPKEHGRPPSSSSREETAETENTRS
jgi:hypothetical protein